MQSDNPNLLTGAAIRRPSQPGLLDKIPWNIVIPAGVVMLLVAIIAGFYLYNLEKNRPGIW